MRHPMSSRPIMHRSGCGLPCTTTPDTLSRSSSPVHLAERGHEVLHLYSTRFQTPKGPLDRLPDDPPSFAIEGIDLGERFHKYSFLRRLLQERRYGGLLARRLVVRAGCRHFHEHAA